MKDNYSTNEHINALRQIEVRLEERLLKHIERRILQRTSRLEQDIKQTILQASSSYHQTAVKNFVNRHMRVAAKSFSEPLNDIMTNLEKIF